MTDSVSKGGDVATTPRKRKRNGRIFVNYRRDDARGYAGRLSDTLEIYFGEGRIFRDVEDIAGGSSFGDVINKTLDEADAVIVLIGKNWLTAKLPDGTLRINDPKDWVVREVAATLEKGTPIFPVLIDGATIPRTEELPESIQPLVERNAVHISDQRWNHDVTRLAQMIALDIPGSVAERKLTWVNRLISIALFISVLLTLGTVTANLTLGADRTLETLTKLYGVPTPDADGAAKAKVKGKGESADEDESDGLFSCKRWKILFPGFKRGAAVEEVPYFGFGVSALTFVVILGSVVALAFFVSLVEADRRGYVYAAILTGAIGSLFFFILICPVATRFEPIVNVFGSTITAFAMLALMNLSGMKAT